MDDAKAKDKIIAMLRLEELNVSGLENKTDFSDATITVLLESLISEGLISYSNTDTFPTKRTNLYKLTPKGAKFHEENNGIGFAKAQTKAEREKTKELALKIIPYVISVLAIFTTIGVAVYTNSVKQEQKIEIDSLRKANAVLSDSIGKMLQHFSYTVR